MERVLLIVALAACAAACGTPAKEAAKPANSGTQTMPPDVTIIHTPAEAAAAIGKTVRLTGTAQDAKIAGVVVADDLVVYCLDVDYWAKDVAGTTVTVEGTLERTDEFKARNEGGVISQGTSGSVLVIRHCRRLPGAGAI